LHQNVGQKQKKFVAPKRQPGVVWARLGATKKIEKSFAFGRRNSATFGPWEGKGEGWKMLERQGSAGFRRMRGGMARGMTFPCNKPPFAHYFWRETL
jgi:hypothetical protein